MTFKWRLKAARSQAVGRRGALSSQKKHGSWGGAGGPRGVCPAGGGTGAETREGPAQGRSRQEPRVGSDTVQWGQKPGCAEGRRAALGPGICGPAGGRRTLTDGSASEPPEAVSTEEPMGGGCWRAWVAGGATGEAPAPPQGGAPGTLSVAQRAAPGGWAWTCANRPDCLGTARRFFPAAVRGSPPAHARSHLTFEPGP